MKLKNKTAILFILMAIISVIFCLNSVQAVGRVSQAWKIVRDGSKDADLLYRTFTTPHESTVKTYDATSSTDYVTDDGTTTWPYIKSNGVSGKAKWIYNAPLTTPTYGQYNTSRVYFHKSPMTTYTQGSGSWGYSDFSASVGYKLGTISDAVNSSQHIMVSKLNKNSINEIYSITSLSGVYSSVAWGTGLTLQHLNPIAQPEYRYALVKVSGYNQNVYVADNIIYSNQLSQLIDKLDGDNSCYVSNELISLSYNGPYEVSETAYDFTKQEGKTWSGSANGTADNGNGSAINLYDNIIQFPNSSNRKVYIRHIDIGKETNINTTIRNNGTKINAGTNAYILVSGDKKTNQYNITDKTQYSEYYQDIEVTQSIVKYALELEELNCLGYNFSVSNNFNTAVNNISSKVGQGSYESGSMAEVEGAKVDSNDDVVVIEFYYTKAEVEKEKEEDDVNEPEKNINGKVFVNGETDKTGVCRDDSDGQDITSIPSGSSATVGIHEIPQYMAGAINLKENKKDYHLTLTLTLQAGPNSVKKEYRIPYSIKYYNVTNMLVYRINKMTIYNSGKGYAGTFGNHIFKWSTKNVEELNKAATVSLSAVNSITANDTNSISNATNYYSFKLTGDLTTNQGEFRANHSGTGTKEHTGSIEKEYVTIGDWNSVDCTNYGVIDSYKTEFGCADEKVEIATTNEYEALKAQQDAQKTVDDLKPSKESTCGKVTTAYNAYIDAKDAADDECETKYPGDDKATVDEKKICKDTPSQDEKNKKKIYDSLSSSCTDLTNKLTEAEDDLTTKTQQWQTAQQNLADAISYRNNLTESRHRTVYNAYQDYLAIKDNSATTVATKLGLKATITVKDMLVNVKDLSGNAQYPLYTQKTKEKVINLSSIGATNNIYTSDTAPTISRDKYNNLTRTVKKEDFTNTNNIDLKSVLNGVRGLAGFLEYKTEVAIGGSAPVTDTAYYGLNATTFSVRAGKVFSKRYTVKYTEVEPTNIYTPITVETKVNVDKDQVVNQTGVNQNAMLIQINTPFTIELTNNEREDTYTATKGNPYTTPYNAGFYIKFDFDVHEVKIGGKKYKDGQRINEGTWIGFLSGNNVTVTAKAYGSLEDNTLNLVSDEEGHYTVRAVAANATDVMRNTSKLYPDLTSLTTGMSSTVHNICNNPSYFAEETRDVIILNRTFGFRITDVKDVSWKNIFRTTSGSSVNKHTGNVYYTGTTKWDTKSTSLVNKISSRTASEIGRNPLRILPLGPYKNTDITKISAPKLGYRFSYDLSVTGSYYKVTGGIRTDKEVIINTRFYYISKDGKTFIKESNGGKGIYLFYKNSNGKYVKIGTDGGNYELKFTPNDGYRYIQDSTKETLATSLVSLGNLRTITLKYNMATPSDNRAYMTYYGEYKLPNSTIAVEVDSNGKYDINKPLKNGYIGVIFDITAQAGKGLKYSTDTKDEPNTSQWDYEGFLGFTNYGNKVKDGEVSLKLEKGTWEINDATYNAIKGTVILYDIDQRAASDYD